MDKDRITIDDYIKNGDRHYRNAMKIMAKVITINDTNFLVDENSFIKKNELIEKQTNTIQKYVPKFKIGMVVKTKDEWGENIGVVAEVHCGYDPKRSENFKSCYALIVLNNDGLPKGFYSWCNEENMQLVCEDLEYGYKLLSYYERHK